MRLRRGKARAIGGVPSGASLSSRPAVGDRRVQARVLRRVDLVDAAGQHGDRAGGQGGLMGGGVDAARQAGGDDEARLPQGGGQLRREAPAGQRGIARADERQGRARPSSADVADRRQHRRRVGQGRQGGRVGRIAQYQEAPAGRGERLLPRGRCRRRTHAARPGAGRPRRAEMLQRLVEGDRSDARRCAPAAAGRGVPRDRDRDAWGPSNMAATLSESYL